MSQRHQPIPLSEPHFFGNEWRYVKECLDEGWVSSAGPFVSRFEQEIAAYVGATHAVAVVNGTAGLHVALLAVGVQPEDEVIVPNLTFIAPVNAVRYVQAYPVLIDADPHTWQLDPQKVEEFLHEECECRDGVCFNKKSCRPVRAIIAVHILGLACDMDRIVAIAERYGLKVVEDAAEAMGVRYRNRHVGTFGDIGVFSFNGNKIITAGGGGMVVTNHAGYSEKIRYLTTQAKDDALEYIHNAIGYNYRLTNIQAAIGVAQLEQLDGFIERKRAMAAYYDEAFKNFNDITRMPRPLYCEPTFWLYTILLDQTTSLVRRKEVLQLLNRSGLCARPFWHTIHNLLPYRQCHAFKIEHSLRLYERGISLPSSVAISVEDLERCVHTVREILGRK